MTKKAIITICLLGVVGGVLFFNRDRLFQLSERSVLSKVSGASPLPSPSPPAFQEMTIPSLRERSYVSSLSDFQRVGTNPTYSTFTTSYDSDGLRINALLTQPSGTPPEGGWPAIIFIHGYIAPSLYRTQERYVAYVDYLARNNFVVFKIDLRGHGSSDGEASGAYYSADYIIDTLNARAALQTLPMVNPSKIGLWGHSMAGNVVLRTLAARPEIPAAVIWAGAVYSYEDFQRYGLNDASYRPTGQSLQRQRRRQQLFDTYGQFSRDSDFWRQVSPMTYLKDFQGALQLHHAKDDAVVSIQYSRDLQKELAGTQIPHELFEYERGGHNLTGASFTTAMRRTGDFFKKYLEEEQ